MNDRFKFRMWDKYREEYIYFDFTSLSGALANIEVKIIEQCTGLRDKNGTLIYEGDIVKGWNGKEYIIRWCFDVYSRKSDGFAGFTKQSIINPECEYILGTEMTEIIGNIHDKG